MPPLPVIVLIGQDAALTYLIERYADRSGYEVLAQPIVPALPTIHELQPIMLIFASMVDLEAAPAQLVQLEIPLIVCSAVNDQARAHELGADYCLVHPLNYDGFLAALTAAHASQRN
jgi:DNA-binding response OmpR family regulator